MTKTITKLFLGVALAVTVISYAATAKRSKGSQNNLGTLTFQINPFSYIVGRVVNAQVVEAGVSNKVPYVTVLTINPPRS